MNLILNQKLLLKAVRMQLSGNLTVRQELDSNILSDKFNIIWPMFEIQIQGLKYTEIDLPPLVLLKDVNILAVKCLFGNDVTFRFGPIENLY